MSRSDQDADRHTLEYEVERLRDENRRLRALTNPIVLEALDLPAKQYHVEIVQGAVHHSTSLVPEHELLRGVVDAVHQLKAFHNGFTILVSEVTHPMVTSYGPPLDQQREADRPHGFESLRAADEGGLGPCAICGHPRGALIHG